MKPGLINNFPIHWPTNDWKPPLIDGSTTIIMKDIKWW